MKVLAYVYRTDTPEQQVFHPSDITVVATAPAITAIEASHVLAHFGAGGYPAGSFTRTLIRATTAADPANRARLALGFPGYVAAVDLAQNDPAGIAKLQAIARAHRDQEAPR